jgi:hypothetical protein
MSDVPARRSPWFGYAIWTALLLLVGSPAAARLPEPPGLLAASVLLAWSAVHALALVSVAFALGAFAGARWRAVTVASATLLAAYVWVDALLVALLGRHFEPGALRHLAQEQALTTLGISAVELLLAGALLLGMLLAGAWATRAPPTRRGALRALALAVLADAGCSVVGMVTRFEGLGQLTGLHEAMPLAWDPRDDLLLVRLTGHPPRELESTFLFPDGRYEPLRRPLRPAPAPALARRLDVLIVVVESLRADALADLPALERLAARALVAERHYSAGNCTLVGAFSLYTGLSPMFMTADDTWRGGAGLEAFLRAGYEVTLSASASLNMQLPERLLSRPGGAIVGQVLPDLLERDERGLDRAVAWLERPQRGAGLFALFLDGTHWPYAAPGVDGGAPRLDDSWLVRTEAAALHARYRQRVRELSARLERLVAAAEARQDDLVVVFTGDHGEAFGEHGVLMHGSRLDDEQLRVPLLLALPGVPPGRLPGPSVHQDVLPTVLGYLGATGLDDGGGGVDLLATPGRATPPVVACCGLGEPVGYAALQGDRKVLFTFGRDGVRYRGELLPGDVVRPNATPDEATRAALEALERRFHARLE